MLLFPFGVFVVSTVYLFILNPAVLNNAINSAQPTRQPDFLLQHP